MRERGIKLETENFKRVIAIVEQSVATELEHEKIFRFNTWFNDYYGEHLKIRDVVEHPCGTACCIGGWGCIFHLYDTQPEMETRVGRSGFNDAIYSDDTADKFYGLYHNEGRYLYYGYFHPRGTRAPELDVLKKLRHILETGQVIDNDYDIATFFADQAWARINPYQDDDYDAQ